MTTLRISQPFLRPDLLEAGVPEEGVRDAFGAQLIVEGQRDPNVVILSADLAGSTKVLPFRDKVDANRFINIGISEQDLIGTAAGLALTGKNVFVSTFAIFLTGRCWEQIRQSVCHTKLSVKLVSTHGGVSVGPDGGSHQMCEDISLMRTLPTMSVIVPGDAEETRQVISHVARDMVNPYYVRTSRVKFPNIYSDEYEFQFGKGVTLCQSDNDQVTIIACGVAVKRAVLAAALLAKEGIGMRVINMPTIKPIDTELVGQAAEETGLIVTVEEHTIFGGLGSAVCEAVAETCPVPVKRLGIPDVFGQSGQAEDLLKHFGITPEAIAAETRQAVERKSQGAIGACSPS